MFLVLSFVMPLVTLNIWIIFSISSSAEEWLLLSEPNLALIFCMIASRVDLNFRSMNAQI